MTPRHDLARELDGPLPPLDLLTDAETRDLLMLFREAKSREVVALSRSIDTTLSALPRPLRAITRKIMFGDI
ncbi:hypothetical protein GV794_05650 [Nocardia cyriacigeorgica]|uniref:Uncharacterized protein n=1 Tax=Nocardia cyriacigeorgica TaxID=135487 RepID=A0A6P1D618_9NOCA|nr:hypothetical protein [Nocardia cyriacigeorgica]NEW37567.1 hypothetical protein [Nocardia cyriacigeorgica]NEW45009.1 hypothetical protein [Nocardia cyriacigeorgica]NEW49045.1 hypothetical protein [Nocardia cyriacigeorgica]NEW55146.1 hypothetical protein [Nocardia cyriacigeorgica]